MDISNYSLFILILRMLFSYYTLYQFHFMILLNLIEHNQQLYKYSTYIIFHKQSVKGYPNSHQCFRLRVF